MAKSSSSTIAKKIRGYAARFSVLSKPLADGVRERIQPGAFSQVLRSSPDVCCLLNHNANHILGRTTSGTLRLSEDSEGLRYEVDLPPTSYAADAAAAVKRGDLNAASFAFKLEDGDASYAEEVVDGIRCMVRTIKNFSKVFDVSPCSQAAYAGTSAMLRSEGVERRVTPIQRVSLRVKPYEGMSYEASIANRKTVDHYRRELLELIFE